MQKAIFGKITQYHTDGTLPQNNEVFVFGSNVVGRHGLGAAKQALVYGAVYGCGFGRYGNTYAIATKDEYLKPLYLKYIEIEVRNFVQYTWDNPEYRFFVTSIGCGLAGYKPYQIAPMFLNAINCSFPENWKEYL